MEDSGVVVVVVVDDGVDDVEMIVDGNVVVDVEQGDEESVLLVEHGDVEPSPRDTGV